LTLFDTILTQNGTKMAKIWQKSGKASFIRQIGVFLCQKEGRFWHGARIVPAESAKIVSKLCQKWLRG
jgi:hypothetical protein